MGKAEAGMSALLGQLQRSYLLAQDSGEPEVADLLLQALEELARRDAQAARVLDKLYLRAAQRPAIAVGRTRAGKNDS